MLALSRHIFVVNFVVRTDEKIVAYFYRRRGQQLKFPAVPWSATKARIAQPELDYMAPEVQLQTAPYATTASDIFALGSLIFAVYTGTTPIRAAYSVTTYASHARQVIHHNVCCCYILHFFYLV